MTRSGQAPVGVCIVGPTASGKSAVALAAARRLPGLEIVSADAFQVYRGMDVGTATPTPDERAEVRHHLIDVVEPSEEFDVARFRAAYLEVVDDLEAREARAVLVGGTGLYQRIVVDRLEPPGRWPDLRAQLEAEAGATGPELLHRRLVDLDPTAAGRMEPTNTRRIVRALEVCIGSGRPFSSFGPGLDTYPESDVVQVGLRWARPALRERIEQRVHRMISDGFVDEVHTLLSVGPLSRTAAQALGYREIAEVVAGRLDLDEATRLIIDATVRLANRQERWFRRDPRLRWVDITTDPIDEALPLVLELLRR